MLGLVGDWLGLSFDEVVDPAAVAAPGEPSWTVLRWDGSDDGREVALPEVLFSSADEAWLTASTAPGRPLASVAVPVGRRPEGGQARLPVLYGSKPSGDRPWVERGPRLELTVDVLGGMFWLLARCEELVSSAGDIHGRFPFEASLAAAEGFVDRPLADEYAALLGAAIGLRWPELPAPGPAQFKLRLTHDIDTPFAAWGRSLPAVVRSTAGDLVRRRDPILAAARARAALDARSGRYDRDPGATFGTLMDVAEAHGLQCQFYFLSGTDPAADDFRYRLADAPFPSILRRIHERGHDIGLHAGYATPDRSDLMADELAALKAACAAVGIERHSWGVRQHYLRWRWPVTALIQESLGLAHDSTIGFAEAIGFRSGTCHEYSLFDPIARRPLALLERPLLVMDGTLLEYMGLDLDASASRVRALIARCRPTGGEAVLLVHNHTVAPRKVMGWYRELVAGLVG